MLLDHHPDHAPQLARRQAREDRVAVTLDRGSLCKKPVDQPTLACEAAADHRCAQRDRAIPGHLPEKLGSPIDIQRIRQITLSIGASLTGENAIRGEMHELCTYVLADYSETMRK